MQQLTSWFLSWWRCPHFRRDPSWQEHNAWYQDALNIGSPRADFALEYAKEKYRHVTAIGEVLDRKAEWSFAIAAALCGVLFSAKGAFGGNAVFAVPSFVGFLLAMCVSVRARSPTSAPTPLSVRAILDYGHKEPSIVAWMAASYHLAIEGQKRVDEWKSRQINRAGWLIVAAAALMLLLLAAQPRFSGGDGGGGGGAGGRAIGAGV